MNKIYLDNAATTPLLPEVADLIDDINRHHYGNPSSIHSLGRKSKVILESARKDMAELLNCGLGEMFFTSCATESHALLLHGAVNDLGVECIISSQIEHHCILHLLEAMPIKVVYLDNDVHGNVDLGQLSTLLEDSSMKTMVSLMHVNNELGTILPMEEVAKICEENSALFHSDTVQSVGKLNLNLTDTSLHFAAGSAHKFHGPKGIGFAYISDDHEISPMLVGGSQERNMRSGTENVAYAAGMALALKLALIQREERTQKIQSLKSRFKTKLKDKISGVSFNGPCNVDEIYAICSVSFPDHPKADLLPFNLDIAGICCSAGSACSSGVEHDSHVLKAINHDSSRKTIRFSFSHFNTDEEIDTTVDVLSRLFE